MRGAREIVLGLGLVGGLVLGVPLSNAAAQSTVDCDAFDALFAVNLCAAVDVSTTLDASGGAGVGIGRGGKGVGGDGGDATANGGNGGNGGPGGLAAIH